MRIEGAINGGDQEAEDKTNGSLGSASAPDNAGGERRDGKSKRTKPKPNGKHKKKS